MAVHSYWPDVPLTNELLSKAEKELNEKVDERQSKICALREAVLSVDNLKSRTDEEFLLRFLRARKFSTEKSLELIKGYYHQKRKLPHLYKRLQTTAIPDVLGVNLLGMLPHKDREGRAIFVFNSVEMWDTSIVPLEDIIIYCILTLERAIIAEDVQINGIVCLADCRGFGLQHVRASNPFSLAQLFAVTQRSFPSRFKQFHIINQPAIFSIVFQLIKAFLPEKFHERFIFHGKKMNSLHEYLDVNILPEEFGGRLKKFDNNEWNKALIEHDPAILKYKDHGFISSS